MAVSILIELNQELTRLSAAGSRLGAGDPRLKKLVPPLRKYGEKAPVFLKLADLVEELLISDAHNNGSQSDDNQSALKLIETKTFLLSILSTQGETLPYKDEFITEMHHVPNGEPTIETVFGYRVLSSVIEALTTTGSNRMEIVKDAYEKGAFKDARLYKIAVEALGDKYAEIAEYMANTVLPSIGGDIYPFLLDGYNVKGGVIDGRRLTVMHKIKGRDMLPWVDEAVEKGSAPVKVEAVKIMSEYPAYEKTLLTMLDESKLVREEVMKALVKLNSKTGIDRLIAIFKGEKAGSVKEALSFGTGEYLTDELLKTAAADYQAVKDVVDAMKDTSETADTAAAAVIQRLKDDINALKNKRTDGTAAFLQKMLSEDYLVKAESVFPKDKKQTYYYQRLEDSALEALYYSGKGNDFIWELFTATQEGFLSKLFMNKKKKKEPPKMLYGYAFHIGAYTLSAEEFYNVFFKTHLYKEISKEDYRAFENTFLGEGPHPAFSPKIARYFVAHMNDYHISLAVKIVSSDDHETLNLLAERVRANLEKNVYSTINYDILKRLSEVKHKSFQELYEVYRSKGRGRALEIYE